MAGDGGLNVPKEIWSPTGGFYADPKHWRRNTAVAAVAMGAILAYAFSRSVKMEKRHKQPYGFIPSQWWYKGTSNFPRA